jgi:predicted nicotinamide N-methyase
LTNRAAFIRANTALIQPPLTPEIRLHLATEIVPIWKSTEEQLAAQGVPPPFWAFAWAGGQALARYILDRPKLVRDKTVLDFAAGSGIVSIAAMKAGAASASGVEIDDYAVVAMALNAGANDVAIECIKQDLVGRDGGWDVVLAGDVCYEREMSARVFEWLSTLARRGAFVLIGDPGRNYLPKDDLEALQTYEVPTTRELEDREIRRTTVYRVSGTVRAAGPT